MATIVRNVREIDKEERQALEHVLGQALEDHQQLIVQIVNGEALPTSTNDEAGTSFATLPPWCNVYLGLSDPEIEAVEKVILNRSDLTRLTE